MRPALCLVLALLPLASASAGARNPLDAVRLEDLTATRERPLFLPTRRSPTPARVEAPPAPAPPPVDKKAVESAPPPFDLIGAVVGEGTALALLRNRASNKIVRLRLGDEAGGWRVSAVGLRSVLLELDGRTESLAIAAPLSAPGTADVPLAVGRQEAVAPQPVAQLTRVLTRLRHER